MTAFLKEVIVNKLDVALMLKEIAFFMRLNGGYPAKAKQYQKTGEALLLWSEELTVPVQIGVLARLPHIGPAMAQLITEIVITGASALHRQLRGDYPSSLAELGDIPELTPKQIYLLYRHAGIRSLADLRLAVRTPTQLLGIPTFGPCVFARLCKTLSDTSRRHDRVEVRG